MFAKIYIYSSNLIVIKECAIICMFVEVRIFAYIICQKISEESEFETCLTFYCKIWSNVGKIS